MTALRDARRAALMELRERKDLTPGSLMEEARDKDHPFHTWIFNKNPKQAAEAYYVSRAAELIRRVRITYSVGESDLRSTRAFVSVDPGDGRRYEPAEAVAADPLMRALVLRDMERDWKQLKARYQHFAEFADLVLADLTKEQAA